MAKHFLLIWLTATFLHYTANAQMDDPIPEHDNFTIASKLVNEDRVINVWTPPEYKNGKKKFPVLYMPDGGIKEDFPHIANTLSQLIAEKKIPPYILVGIENTNRARDLTGASQVQEDGQYCPLTDGSSDFRNFILNELIPKINSDYRTQHKKGIIGESLAGLFVVETMLLNPDSMDFYIAFDPSLWWNGHQLVENAESYLTKFPKKPIAYWFAGSSAEDIHDYTRMLEKTLQTSAPKKLIWNYSDEPEEQHNTIFRATKEKALIWTLNSI